MDALCIARKRSQHNSISVTVVIRTNPTHRHVRCLALRIRLEKSLGELSWTTRLENSVAKLSRIPVCKITLGSLSGNVLFWGNDIGKCLLEKPVDKVTWNDISANNIGELSWHTLLGNSAGAPSWKTLLGNLYANLSWKTLVESSHGDSLRKLPSGTL